MMVVLDLECKPLNKIASMLIRLFSLKTNKFTWKIEAMIQISKIAEKASTKRSYVKSHIALTTSMSTVPKIG